MALSWPTRLKNSRTRPTTDSTISLRLNVPSRSSTTCLSAICTHPLTPHTCTGTQTHVPPCYRPTAFNSLVRLAPRLPHDCCAGRGRSGAYIPLFSFLVAPTFRECCGGRSSLSKVTDASFFAPPISRAQCGIVTCATLLMRTDHPGNALRLHPLRFRRSVLCRNSAQRHYHPR